MGLERLDANQPPERFYRGGAKIDRFRGTAKTTSAPRTG